MTEKFLITALESAKYNTLITLLDYRTNISFYLNSIKLENVKDGVVLIDTILCSGDNRYRFISFVLNKDGTLNLDSNKYVNGRDDVLEVANSALKTVPMFVKNSVLPKVEIDRILTDSSKI